MNKRINKVISILFFGEIQITNLLKIGNII